MPFIRSSGFTNRSAVVLVFSIPDNSYPRDNRLTKDSSSHLTFYVAPRCRLLFICDQLYLTSFRQCSCLNKIRELGSDRCKSGWSISLVVEFFIIQVVIGLRNQYARTVSFQRVISSFHSSVSRRVLVYPLFYVCGALKIRL